MKTLLSIASIFLLTLFSSVHAVTADTGLSKILLKMPKTIGEFQLVDHNDKQFNLERLKGKWTFMSFGYTNCPDICPTTLFELDKVYQLLSEPPFKLDSFAQVVFVTVDPARDDVTQLNNYMRYFNKNFIGVTGGLDKINHLTKQLGIKHKRHDYMGEGYPVDHSASILIINPEGKVVAKIPPTFTAEIFNKQFREISNYSKGVYETAKH